MASSSLITGSNAPLAAAARARLGSRTSPRGWNVRPSSACRSVEVRISSSRQQQQPQRRRRSPVVAAAAAAMDDDEDDAGEDDIGMTEEEIKQAYEALYGPSSDRKKQSGFSTSLEDEEGGRGRGRKSDDTGTATRRGRGGVSKDGFEESVVQVRRVTKVVKGGKQLHFRVVSVVGDKKGKVGVGVGKAKEVIAAVQKSVKDARRHMVIVPITKYKTFPHRADGHYGAADVMLRPASPGTGVLAGGSVRIVLEMAGIENALGKQLGGSDNSLNNARATLDAISQMRHYHEVAELRNIPVQELWK